MKKIKILSVSRHPEILAVMARLVNKQPNWYGESAVDANEAEAFLLEEEFDLILIGAGITPEEEKQLEGFVQKLSYSVSVVRHYGGGSGLLYTEVTMAMDKVQPGAKAA